MRQVCIGHVGLAPGLAVLLDCVRIGRFFPRALPCLGSWIVDQRELRYRPLKSFVHRGLLLDLDHAARLAPNSKALPERGLLGARVSGKIDSPTRRTVSSGFEG